MQNGISILIALCIAGVIGGYLLGPFLPEDLGKVLIVWLLWGWAYAMKVWTMPIVTERLLAQYPAAVPFSDYVAQGFDLATTVVFPFGVLLSTMVISSMIMEEIKLVIEVIKEVRKNK